MNFDVITLGSATIDVFVKAKEEVRKHKHHVDICYHLGDKLLISDLHFASGGGGTNTAVAFSRLGLKTGYIGALGEDNNALAILNDLQHERVEFLGARKKGNSGYSVILLGESDRTILAYKGINNALLWNDMKFPFQTKWLYLSTMIGKSLQTSIRLALFMKKQGASLAANISSYEAALGTKILYSLLSKLDILVLNKEELLQLAKKKNMRDALNLLSSIIPGIIVVTDRKNPIYASHQQKTHIKKIKPVTPVDMTGAGDAFASGFTYGIMQKKDIPTSLDYGYKESIAVIKSIGAKQGLLRKL